MTKRRRQGSQRLPGRLLPTAFGIEDTDDVLAGLAAFAPRSTPTQVVDYSNLPAPQPRDRPRPDTRNWRCEALSVQTDTQADFAEWFGLPGYCARVAGVLYEAAVSHAKPIPQTKLAALADVRPGTVYVAHYHLKDAMSPAAIEFRRSTGTYVLTAAGLAECMAAIQGMESTRRTS